MKININVKKTFKINGKEYSSLEEMPEDIRELFAKAQQRLPAQVNAETSATRTKIIVNGTEYASVDAMPADIRSLYEKAMKAGIAGSADSAALADIVKGMPGAQTSRSPSVPVRQRQSPAIESSFSLKKAIVSALVLALIVLLYVLLKR